MRPFVLFPIRVRCAPPHVANAHRRRGRVLVECCVSMVLLAGAGTLGLLVTANSAHLVDESRQRDRVHHAATVHLSRVVAMPCFVTTATAREPVGPRATLDVSSTSRGAVHTMSVEAWWQGSGFAGNRSRNHTTTVGGWCE